jgi:hypothetical protein
MERNLKELNTGLHVSFLIYVSYMRKDCNRDKIRYRDFDEFARFQHPPPPQYDNVFLECPVSLYGQINGGAPPERLDGFYSYSPFRSLTIIGRNPVNINILAPKTATIHVSPKNQNGDSPTNGSNDSDYI